MEDIKDLINAHLNTWIAGGDNYHIIESEEWKKYLGTFNIKYIKTSGARIPLFVMAASIHHGKRTKIIIETAWENSEEQLYGLVLFDMIRQRSYYCRVMARCFWAFGLMDKKTFATMAQQQVREHKVFEQFMGQFQRICDGYSQNNVVISYAEALQTEKDSYGVNKARSVLSEFV